MVSRGVENQRLTAGEELTWPRDGASQRGSTQLYGEPWEWIQDSAPPLSIEGIRLGDFLEWVSRETGLAWRFGEPGSEQTAEAIRLHGSIEGLTPEQALSVVLPSCGYRHRRIGNEIVLTSR